MALSNIFREPRREITETVTGLTIVGTPIAAVFGFAAILKYGSPGHSFGDCLGAAFIASVLLIVAAFVFMVLLVAVHSLGEAACNSLQKRGINLRPQRRQP